MKRFNILLVFLVLFSFGFGQETMDQTKGFLSFGEKFDDSNVLNGEEILEKYSNLTALDTIQTTFTATVKEVCQAKGCWMKLELKDGKEAMVRFKDYGFFMPKDIAGKAVVVNGKAFADEMSIDDQKHYAEDAGATKEEIAKIVRPKKMFSFLASGVSLKQ